VGHGDPLGLLGGVPVLGIPHHQHGGGEDVLGQVEQGLVGFPLFHDVADVAGGQAQAVGGGDGVLGGDVGVAHRQEEVPHAGLAGGAVGLQKAVVPLFAVGAENQYQRGGGDEGLVVAGVGQLGLESRVGDVQDGVELLAAGGGGGAGGGEDGGLMGGGDGLVQEGADGFPGVELLKGLVHRGHLTVLFDREKAPTGGVGAFGVRWGA